MIIRRGSERGHVDHGWLDTYHTFSFNAYWDPDWMGFHGLRVINEDRVKPGMGFPTHPHREMEIITYVMSGAITHRDSMGHEETLRAGEIQVMSAGTGITHSEFNTSSEDGLHLLQIWIQPDRPGVEPRYCQRSFPIDDRTNKLVPLVAQVRSAEAQGALGIHADARILGANLVEGANVAYSLPRGYGSWVHIACGTARVNGELLEAGSAAGIESGQVSIEASKDAEVLLFELARGR